MKRYLISGSLYILCTILENPLMAQENNATLDSFMGTWKGTSLCQVKNSPRHDEIVVYRITKGRTSDSCEIQMSKIVNGAEEEMGTLPCRFHPDIHELESSAYNSKWIFLYDRRKLHGTLFTRNLLYRIIEVTLN